MAQQGLGAIAPTSGLSYLGQMNEMHINQKVELLEVVTEIDVSNRYEVLDSQGKKCYYVFEQSECCNRVLCKDHRGFVMHMVDSQNREVLKMERSFRCCAGCCWCKSCGYLLDVTAEGVPIGTVRQSQYFIKPTFSIESQSGEEMFRISGPICICHGPCCPCEIPFDVYPSGGSEPVAHVSRVYSGCAKEAFTKANCFKVVFKQNLDVNSKALIFSAAYLLDMMYFEHA